MVVIFGRLIRLSKRYRKRCNPISARARVASLDMADNVIGGAAFDMHADIRIFAGNTRKARKEGRKHADGGGIDGADRNLARRLAGNRAGDLGRQIDFAEDPDRAFVEGCPGPRQFHPCGCRSGFLGVVSCGNF